MKKIVNNAQLLPLAVRMNRTEANPTNGSFEIFKPSSGKIIFYLGFRHRLDHITSLEISQNSKNRSRMSSSLTQPRRSTRRLTMGTPKSSLEFSPIIKRRTIAPTDSMHKKAVATPHTPLVLSREIQSKFGDLSGISLFLISNFQLQGRTYHYRKHQKRAILIPS